jgi:hypothetical protein
VSWRRSDPRTSAFFQHRYESLRALHVTQFSFEHDDMPEWSPPEAPYFTYPTDSVYCFSLPACPKFEADLPEGAPHISEDYTFSLLGGQWLITTVTPADHRFRLQPAPWEAGDLVFAQGRRVTVAAPASLAKKLPAVVSAADAAAVVDDRFARLIGNPQQRYRIYLADAKSWKRWFGQQVQDDVDGYAIGINGVQSEVVIQAATAGTGSDLRNLLQHEMGHVATLSGSDAGNAQSAAGFGVEEISEGIAEYIAYWPKRARDSGRVAAVRRLENGPHRPRTIGAWGGHWASAKEADGYYGFAHFVMDCLAQTYGESKMIEFVKQVARDGKKQQDVAPAVFGKSFDAVDQGCLTWIRRQV